MDFIAHSIIIDDIVFPDGRTAWGVLGGSGPQICFAMKLWADQVGLLGAIGGDFPGEAQAWLDGMAIDCAGVRRYPDWQSLRAWQLMEWDGRRLQIWRTRGAAIAGQLALSYDHIPASYRTAKAFHFGVHPESPNLAVVHALRQHGMIVSLEVFKHSERLLSDDELRALCSAGQIFSPNLYEAQTMIGAGEPHELVRRFAAAGAEIVALRMGEDGALIYRQATGESVHIPATPVTVVDTVGAGNAWCGGFVTGWVQTGDLRLAGQYGSVAASFLIEQVGVPPLGPDYRRLARERLRQLQGLL